MKLAEFSLILVGVVLNAIAQLFLKAGAQQIGRIDFVPADIWGLATGIVRNGHILSGLTCYVCSVVIWIMALSRVEVSVAYPMLSIGYVINAIFAWWLFGEAVGVQRLAGIAVIILGVIIVARS